MVLAWVGLAVHITSLCCFDFFELVVVWLVWVPWWFVCALR